MRPLSAHHPQFGLKRSTQRALRLLALLPLAVLAACATPASRIERAPQAFAQLPVEQQARVKLGEVGVGFDAVATKLAVGEPDRIVQRETAEGRTEVWTYYQAYSSLNPGFCPGFDAYGFYPNRFGFYGRNGPYGFNPYGGNPAFFGGGCFLNQTVLEEQLRVTFKNGKVTSVERQVP